MHLIDMHLPMNRSKIELLMTNKKYNGRKHSLLRVVYCIIQYDSNAQKP